MPIVSITEAAKLTGRARSTLYRKINAGELSTSKQADGSDGIDTSELIRVFGELQQPGATRDVAPATPRDSDATPPASPEIPRETRLLREQIALLQDQLEEAKEREKRLMGMLESSQRLLAPPERKGWIERVAAAIRDVKKGPQGAG